RLGGRHRERLRETLAAAKRLIFGKRQRIGDSAALEGHAMLALPERMILDLADRELVRGAAEKTGVEERGDVLRRHIAVADAPLRRLDLNEGLQPQQAARAVAHDLDALPAGLRLLGDRCGDLVRAHGLGGHVEGNEDLRHDWRASAAISSSFSPSTRPIGSPSKRAEGLWAQSPKQ